MRLNQVIAVEKNAKTAANTQGAELHKQNKTTSLFEGMVRTFEAKLDDDYRPPENKVVQAKALDNLNNYKELLETLWDTVLTKDTGNSQAKASVKVGSLETGELPVTFLIWLEKQLHDLKTFLGNLPVLDPAKEWKTEPNSQTGLYETDPVKTASTKKVAKVVQLAAATEHHPEQSQLTHEDVIAGFWSVKHLSGALPKTKVDQMLRRTEDVLRAVKVAREEANSTSVTQMKVANDLLSFIVG